MKMKPTGIMTLQTALFGLGLTLVLALPGRAQQEVAPDFYDSNAPEPATQPQKALPAHEPRQAAGNFTLPFAVRCKGKTLSPGNYFVYVDSTGSNWSVTLHGENGAMTVQAREITGLPSGDENMLLVRSDRNRRSIEAIYLQGLGLSLGLVPNNKGLMVTSKRLARIPISVS